MTRVLREPQDPEGNRGAKTQSTKQKQIGVSSRQWALGSKKANSREQLAKIRHQQAVKNQPLSLGFLNSDLLTAYCYLPTSFPWRFGRKKFGEVVLLNISMIRTLA